MINGAKHDESLLNKMKHKKYLEQFNTFLLGLDQ